MSDLASWLLQQVDHDEQVSLLADNPLGSEATELSRHTIAQCQEWLADSASDAQTKMARASRRQAAEAVLKLLALCYAGRPGYDAWRL